MAQSQTVQKVATDYSQHPRRVIAHTVSDTLCDMGYQNDLPGLLSPPEVPDQTGITPGLSELLRDVLVQCMKDYTLSLKTEIKGHFGESSGSGNVTTLHGNWDNTVSQTIKALGESQLDELATVCKAVGTENDPAPNDSMAYGLFLMATGWESEKLARELWNSGTVAHDKGGIDLWGEDGEQIQLGSITRGTGYAKEGLSDDKTNVLYVFDGDGTLYVSKVDGDAGDTAKALAGEVSERDGISKVLIYRSSGDLAINREVGRPFRYLYW